MGGVEPVERPLLEFGAEKKKTAIVTTNNQNTKSKTRKNAKTKRYHRRKTSRIQNDTT